VKAARKEKNWTQRQLAERLSISPYYLKSIENRNQIPSSDLLFKIIRGLDISADTIFYPEQGRDCELVNRLHILLSRFEEYDIELADSVPRRFTAERARRRNAAQRQPANTRPGTRAQEMSRRGGTFI